MISVLPTHIKSFRAFGWIQDPSNLRGLCDVVAIFDCNSVKHKELVAKIIPKLVEKRDGRDELLAALNSRPVKIVYSNLVGTAFTPRSSSRCNGIVQATVKGQGRDFIGDWPADNFVRWAHAFGFIKYNYDDDTFKITEEGLALTKAKTIGEDLSREERELLIQAILAYPPAIRILSLLSAEEDVHLTKFEIGKQLGFVGENGFTSMPQTIFIRSLANIESTKEKNSMKADWEGSSDKYARMISGWLESLGLVEKRPKIITVKIGQDEYSENIGQSYLITASGLTALRRALGKSKHKRIAKNVSWEMLATKGKDREYLRTRRAFIIKCLVEIKKAITESELIDYLKNVGFNEDIETVRDDLKGLVNIGINVTSFNGTYKIDDVIKDFSIPLPQKLAKSELTETKEKLRTRLSSLSHEYLSLVDLAYDSKQNRLFEMKALELLTEECKFEGTHLGGSRKPDGIIYTTDLPENYGVIIDTKAYSQGYNLPISQADEMERYIGENQTRDKNINPNEWWKEFDGDINTYYFMFVSGHFVGNFKSQLERISRNKGVNGTVLAASNLIMCAENIKSGKFTHRQMGDDMFKNDEYIFDI